MFGSSRTLFWDFFVLICFSHIKVQQESFKILDCIKCNNCSWDVLVDYILFQLLRLKQKKINIYDLRRKIRMKCITPCVSDTGICNQSYSFFWCFSSLAFCHPNLQIIWLKNVDHACVVANEWLSWSHNLQIKGMET